MEIDRLLEETSNCSPGYAPDHAAAVSALCAPPAPAPAPVTPPEKGLPRVRQRLRALLHGAAADPSPDSEHLSAFQRRRDNALGRYASLLHETNRKIWCTTRWSRLPTASGPCSLSGSAWKVFPERFPALAPAPEGGFRPWHEPVPERLLVAPGEDAARAERGLLRARPSRSCGPAAGSRLPWDDARAPAPPGSAWPWATRGAGAERARQAGPGFCFLDAAPEAAGSRWRGPYDLLAVFRSKEARGRSNRAAAGRSAPTGARSASSMACWPAVRTPSRPATGE